MGKHVVYVRAREEKELEADGHDPGEWVRDIIKSALAQRTAKAREGVAASKGHEEATPNRRNQ